MLIKTATCSLMTFLVFILLKLELVVTRFPLNQSNNHHCYTCIEPLIGYTDHSDSCKYLNASSTTSEIFIQPCSISSSSRADEYECRKIIISYRSVETYLRRDCVPKGSCSWKDKTRSMIDTPVSNCVYTDERAQKLECIYCCDTPLCNSTNSNRWSVIDQSILFFVVFLSFSFQRENE